MAVLEDCASKKEIQVKLDEKEGVLVQQEAPLKTPIFPRVHLYTEAKPGTLILHFQPPDLRANKYFSCCSTPPNLWYFVKAAEQTNTPSAERQKTDSHPAGDYWKSQI